MALFLKRDIGVGLAQAADRGTRAVCAWRRGQPRTGRQRARSYRHGSAQIRLCVDLAGLLVENGRKRASPRRQGKRVFELQPSPATEEEASLYFSLAAGLRLLRDILELPRCPGSFTFPLVPPDCSVPLRRQLCLQTCLFLQDSSAARLSLLFDRQTSDLRLFQRSPNSNLRPISQPGRFTPAQTQSALH